MSRRRGGAFLILLTVIAVAAGLLIGGGVWLSSVLHGALKPPLAVGCQAVVGKDSYALAVDQSENAALISAVSQQRGMPARAASIALATAMQESKLRNISYGDMDSLGLFQQRPSQDWGTAAEIMDPVYATNAFYNALEKIPGYLDMPVNDAAQIVQGSAFPDAYAKHESMARAFASALTGQSAAAFSCTLAPVAQGAAPATPAQLEAALDAQLGPLPLTVAPVTAPASDASAGSSTAPASKQVSVRIQATGATGWAAAQWAVANASTLGITGVAHDGKAWDRNANDGGTNAGWRPSPNAGAGVVVVTMAG